MSDMKIEAVYTGQKPDYMPLARHLLDRIIAFYKDPENERAFQEWKAKRERGGAGNAVCER